MRLREWQVFLKLTTRKDLLHQGEYLEMIAEVEDLFQTPLQWFTDIGERRQALHLGVGSEDELQAYRGRGLQQCARFVLCAQPDTRGLRVSFNALAHPYSGAHVTHVDLRVPHSLLEEDTRRRHFHALARTWMERLEPICAHAHDCDDHAMQNTESPQLLRLGYGVSEPDLPPLEERPGREWSRGEFRLGATWMTWLGPELRSLLGDDIVDPEALPSEHVAGGRLYCLNDDPRICDDSLHESQRQLRDALGLRAAAKRLGRSFGYWQRRG